MGGSRRLCPLPRKFLDFWHLNGEFCAFLVVLFAVQLPRLHAKMMHSDFQNWHLLLPIATSVQFLVTRNLEMQCEHLGKFIVFFVATNSWNFCHRTNNPLSLHSRKLSLHILCITAQYFRPWACIVSKQNAAPRSASRFDALGEQNSQSVHWIN